MGKILAGSTEIAFDENGIFCVSCKIRYIHCTEIIERKHCIEMNNFIT